MPPLAALAAGLTGSLHCAAMCGPLACAGAGGRGAGAVSWHAGRLAGYGVLGAILGGSGASVLTGTAEWARPALPWVMALGLLVTALDLGRHLAPLPGLGWVTRRWLRVSARLSPNLRSGAIAAATPLLPCGLVYGMSLAALAAGGTLGGAAVLGAFALGGVPALAAAQLQTRLWPNDARWVAVGRRAVPLLAAAVLVWRALAAPAIAATGAAHACH